MCWPGCEKVAAIRGRSHPVTREESNDWVDHYGLDALGNVRWLYSNKGAWDIIDYYPFGGERLSYTNSDGSNTRLFTSKERDTESGNDNFGARYYSSTLGRFLSPDSTSYSSLANPQAWNLYAYTLNNPLRYNDPSGHTLECANGTDPQECQDAIAGRNRKCGGSESRRSSDYNHRAQLPGTLSLDNDHEHHTDYGRH